MKRVPGAGTLGTTVVDFVSRLSAVTVIYCSFSRCTDCIVAPVDVANSHRPTRLNGQVASASGGNVNGIIVLNVFRLPQTVADSIHTARRDSINSTVELSIVSGGVNWLQVTDANCSPVVCFVNTCMRVTHVSSTFLYDFQLTQTDPRDAASHLITHRVVHIAGLGVNT